MGNYYGDIPKNTIIIKICPDNYQSIHEIQNIPSNNYKYQIKLECDSKSHSHSHSNIILKNSTDKTKVQSKKHYACNQIKWPTKHAKCTTIMSIVVQTNYLSVDQIIYRNDQIIHSSNNEINNWDIFNCHSQSISTKITPLNMYSFPIQFFTKLNNNKPSIASYNTLLQTDYPEDSRLINETTSVVPLLTAPIIQLGDGRLVTSLKNKNIQIWDPQGKECLKTFMGHSNELIRIMYQIRDGRMITGADHSLRLWDMEKCVCLKNVNVPNAYFNDIIQLKNRDILTYSEDNFRIWNLNIEGIAIVKGDFFSSVYQLKDGRLVTGHKHGTIKIWDLQTLQQVTSILPSRLNTADIRVSLISQVSDSELIVNAKDSYVMVIRFT